MLQLTPLDLRFNCRAKTRTIEQEDPLHVCRSLVFQLLCKWLLTCICLFIMVNYRTAYDECTECARLLEKYEAATFEDARIHSAFDLANLLGDFTSARHIKLEVAAVTARRYGARAAFIQHQRGVHPAFSWSQIAVVSRASSEAEIVNAVTS
jgi:hypothetical protein